MNSAFEKINDMMEVFKEFRPLLREHLGSARTVILKLGGVPP